jgi:DNA primase
LKFPIKDVLLYYKGKVPRDGFGWKKMKCCFHDDSHASGQVNFSDEYYMCFACGIKGDAIDLIKYKEGLDYAKAVEFAETILNQSGTDLRKTRRQSVKLFGRERSVPKGSKSIPSGRRGRDTTRS